MVLDIHPAEAADAAPKTGRARLDRLRDIGGFLRSCWALPPGSGTDRGDEPREVTLRLSFNRSGGIIGAPRVAYAHPPEASEAQKAFTASALAALKNCTPMPFTSGLGSAIAGVPFAIRFTDGRQAPRTD